VRWVINHYSNLQQNYMIGYLYVIEEPNSIRQNIEPYLPFRYTIFSLNNDLKTKRFNVLKFKLQTVAYTIITIKAIIVSCGTVDQ